MANPVLNQRTIQNQTAWAPPAVAPQVVDRSTVSADSGRAMTVAGAISKTALLLAVLLVTATVTWMNTSTVAPDGTGLSISPLVMVGVIVGFGLVAVLYFKPELARYIAPAYAVVEGFVLGAISKYYDAAFDGIVIQAIGATLAVFAVVLALYATRVIRVTARMRSIIVSATVGLMIFYGFSIVLRLVFGTTISFLSEPSLMGIGFSIFAAALAAANLLLDFDIIERGALQRFDKDFEWYAAFGLLVTIVWLYLELLRLLSKLRSR